MIHKILIPVMLSFVFNGNCDKKANYCSACKHIVDTIEKKLRETENLTYEAGMSHSEQRALGEYKNSELRFIDILDKICSESSDRPQCNYFLGKHEDTIENWFFNQRRNDTDLFEFICVNSSKVCCKDHHFGKKCDVCSGWINNTMCSGHGTCSGDGSRKGTGRCQCEAGYIGDFCENCKDGHFRNRDSVCLPCHESCNGPCDNDTLIGCLGDCKSGWERAENGSCVDLDECARKMHNCPLHQYCMNVPGKFLCKDCHQSCHTCNGEGDGKCIYCQDGYDRSDDNRCLDLNECERGMHTCDGDTFCLNVDGGFKCEKCHKACLNGCTSSSISGCKDCKPGYDKDDSGKGCKDINECSLDPNKCPEGKYCYNKPGSYKCKKCNDVCHLCHGPGPHSCYSCAPGHQMINGVCRGSTLEEEETTDDDEL